MSDITNFQILKARLSKWQCIQTVYAAATHAAVLFLELGRLFQVEEIKIKSGCAHVNSATDCCHQVVCIRRTHKECIKSHKFVSLRG